MENKILDSINIYYTKKIKEYGLTPKGVDWNSTESQKLRFEQLCKVIEPIEYFSILDFGCGYGALLNYLKENKRNFHYKGFDISDEMISQAIKNKNDFKNAVWETKLSNEEIFDYTIASGIFNVKLENNEPDWMSHVKNTLAEFNKHSRKGFSFNMLTSYSNKELMKDYLFYANPGYFFNYCKKNFSKYVALLHDYPLYEFTIIVKK